MKKIDTLVNWLQYSKEIDIDRLISSCLKEGWDYETSISAIERAKNVKIIKFITPRPMSKDKENIIDVGDKSVEIIMRLTHPDILLVGNMLSSDECDALINIAKNNLYRSEVTESETDDSFLDDRRTSQTAVLEEIGNDIVSIVNKRLCNFLSWPSEYTEEIQVQRYGLNEEYQPHYDYFPLKNKKNRVATVIVYLNEPEKGGETLFADIGLNIVPRKGMAVFFSYSRPSPTTLTLHGGSPVLEGEKWILTKFIRNKA